MREKLADAIISFVQERSSGNDASEEAVAGTSSGPQGLTETAVESPETAPNAKL